MPSRRGEGARYELSPLVIRLTVAPVIGLAAEPAMAKTFKLSITGNEGASYAGQCTVIKEARDDVLALEGTVPLERTFIADGLDCRIEAEGRVVVEITHEGGWSRVTTDGGFADVQVR